MKPSPRHALRSLAVALATTVVLGACSEDPKIEHTYPESENPVLRGFKKDSEGLFGSDGILSYGKKDDQGGGSGIAVNSFLWRASLDTLSFMPLASADPFGGVI